MFTQNNITQDVYKSSAHENKWLKLSCLLKKLSKGLRMKTGDVSKRQQPFKSPESPRDL